MKKLIPVIVLLSVFLSGCGSFFEKKQVERGLLADGQTPKSLYDLAQEKLSRGSTAQAIEHYETILAAYPGSKYAMQAQLDIAYSYYKREEYSSALAQLDDFIKRYPSHTSTPYAHYLRCKSFEDISRSFLDGLITDKAERDVQSVKDAYLCYTGLIVEFPQSGYAEDGKAKLAELKNALARHEFYVAQYYTNNKSNIAAVNRCKYLIEHFPKTPSVPDALHLMAYNYDAIGAMKLAEDTRAVLDASYPGYVAEYKLEN
ncbi:MAG: outer membrane protein assembly factor BamD [Gammaproteobacteria bacterium]|nr:outer membrane protein assembly factor BamD [Gammaproteobacteria bacterium]